jgi:hypothetical protein
MAIFFTSPQPVTHAARASFEEALRTDPASVADPAREATNRAEALRTQAAGKLSWGRLAVAIVLLLGLLFAAIYAARDEALKEDLYPLLLHSFELILGAVIGLLTGEAASR